MTRHTLRLGALALLIGAALGGCGKMGGLERPGPMFGQPNPQAAAAADDEADDSRMKTIDARERLRPVPPRADPIPGTQDSSSATQRGVLPDPYVTAPQ